MLDISNECYFVRDNDNPDRNNKLCRYLLYWWFATNLCLITGESNRIELPGCLVQNIRSVCPEEDGMHTGHKSKEQKHRRK